MAKFIDENITYEQFIQWLKEGSEMEFLYGDTPIKINYVKINDVPTFLVTENKGFNTIITKYISRHQILDHRFTNNKRFYEMWNEIELLDIF